MRWPDGIIGLRQTGTGKTAAVATDYTKPVKPSDKHSKSDRSHSSHMTRAGPPRIAENLNEYGYTQVRRRHHASGVSPKSSDQSAARLSDIVATPGQFK